MRALVRRPTDAAQACEPEFLPKRPVNVELAAKQHEVFCQVLKSLGADVTYLEDSEAACPQASLIEDAAVVLDGCAILAAFPKSGRNAELPAIRGWLSERMEVVSLDPERHPGATMVGGDVIVAGTTILTGRSACTNDAGIAAVREIAAPRGYEVREVAVKDCLHLKTACTPLDNETLLVRSDWVNKEALRGFRLLEAPCSEPWAANVQRVGSTICLPSAHVDTARWLMDQGYRVRSIRISELAKLEAGISSLSLKL